MFLLWALGQLLVYGPGGGKAHKEDPWGLMMGLYLQWNANTLGLLSIVGLGLPTCTYSTYTYTKNIITGGLWSYAYDKVDFMYRPTE